MHQDQSVRNELLSTSRSALKTVVRASGVATSGLRPLPDFLVIGAKRGGTTSFYFDLISHPAVVQMYPPPIPGLKPDATKGTHFFDSYYSRGERWYRSYFPLSVTRQLAARRADGKSVTGEASPFYLFHPAAAQRAHAMVPEARIIVLLRDPVYRTYSHWKERRRSEAEELDFLGALDAEPARLAGERERLLNDPDYISYAWEQQSYVTQSLYADCLRPWIEAFGRDNVFVEASENYYRKPDQVLGNVHDFLGIPRRAKSTGQILNAANGKPLGSSVSEELHKRFGQPNRELADLLGFELPWSLS